MKMKTLTMDQVDLRVRNNFQNDILEIFSNVNPYRHFELFGFVFSTPKYWSPFVV